jgi:prepilin-type N-terminal cleavage/methylation domain-containing protein
MRTAQRRLQFQPAHPNHAPGSRIALRRGFTLLQVLLVMAIIAVMAAFVVSSLSRGRLAAQRAECDIHLKAIALALDAYRQENGFYPARLADLRTKLYLQDAGLLHCPGDPRPDGTYEEFYAFREPRDSTELPMVVCPFHEESSRHGTQAYKGVFTTQFATQPALLTGASGATIEHPGGEPVAAKTNTQLHGGDRIRTGSSGMATIRFADGSTAELQENSDVTLLQSFVQEHSDGSLFTLVRQTWGEVTYRVHTGSKYDVVTPTAVAGALGTVFDITVDSKGQTELFVSKGEVSLTTLEMTVEAPLRKKIKAGEIGKGRKPRKK